ncbi:MAG: DUF2066 domain-containing protein [Gammaproteobacteria bacterium]|nr:DUF2066 domain-containing protein [Gammaproteobacteria bacterium]
MLKSTTKIFIFVTTMLACNQSFSAHVASLYNVDILVAEETVASRNQAFKNGLDEVFIRISGDSMVMGKLSPPSPSRYVKQFSYETVTEPVKNEDGELLTHTLKLQYNGSSMEKYLLENGFPVWDKHRTDVVIWVVVRDGKNEYVLKSTDQSVVKTAIESALTRRGVPVRWPVYDNKDKKILSVADIRGGFKEPVLVASKRYSNGPALTGSIIWSGKQWQSSWGLLMETEGPRWNLDNTDYSALVDNAIDQAADVLGTAYAIHNNAGDQQLATIQFDVESVNSIEKYRYIENYLADLNVVENSRPLSVNGQNVVFEVTLRGSEEDFINLIKSDTAFSEMQTPLPVSTELQFVEKIELSAGDTKVVAAPDLNEAVSSEQKNIESIVVEQAPVKRIPVYRYQLMK